MLAVNHSDAVPFVGRDLSPLITGQADPASFTDPVYFMTDDDVTRGLHMNRKFGLGLGYKPVEQPSHVETVIARLDDNHLWKFSRYFDNPQYWTDPGTPGVDDPDTPEVDVKDVLRVQVAPDPPPDVVPQPVDVCFPEWVKGTPEPDEFEMYNLDNDPMELTNLYSLTDPLPQQAVLAQLLAEQRTQKRLTPCSGLVLGQETNQWPECAQ
jgi:choline-sulfatase